MNAALTKDNFTLLTRPHWVRMHRFATRLCRDRDRAEDLVQESLVRAYKARDRYDGRQPLAPWLLAIVRNACWDQLRAAGRRPETPLDDDDLAGDADPDALARALTTERTDRLEQHLLSIPEEFREVLVLIVMEGLSYEEASFVTGAPIGTVRSRLYRARAVLRKKLLDDRELFDASERIR